MVVIVFIQSQYPDYKVLVHIMVMYSSKHIFVMTFIDSIYVRHIMDI